jgi:quinol-cytochrome oxidoreductase complex cytochrome b subunit
MKKNRIIALATIIVAIIIIAIALFSQTKPTTPPSSTPEELPPEETPQNLLVVPEVPLGTIAIVSACFFALIISQMKNRTKLQ